ncbi:hypothetical protein AB0J80_09210 [Actinoplanes sp. NPDC049548]|uniref:hypothetical protein n=1 Tax=Actinoplanes sp. NPDC049548 TaxID=3155152 RepID=UPI0034275E80
MIAVVGSLDVSRDDYRPPLRDHDRGHEACTELGRALADAGCDLVLFSSKPKYVEAWVAQGYAAAPQHGEIRVRPPAHAEVEFGFPQGPADVLVEPDPGNEWELPYYRSLLTADGVIVIGGGQSSRVAGIFAVLHEVPLIAVAAFGGGAASVRANLAKQPNDASEQDITLMGRPWGDERAHHLVAALLAQIARRRDRVVYAGATARRRTLAARLALCVTLLALVGSWLVAAFVGSKPPPGVVDFLLVLATPMAAAGAGALLRQQGSGPQWGWAVARGLGAGLVTVFLYIAGELVSVPDLFARLDAQRLLFFLVPLGFTAGFTFDLVFTKLSAGPPTVPPAHNQTLP